MKLSVDGLITKLQPLYLRMRKYGVFLFIVIFLAIYVYLVQQIGSLIQADPSQTASDSGPKPVNRLKIDEDAVKQITELESQNIEVQSLFDQARQNPFTE